MSKLRRSIAILASAMALSSGALILTTHAADEGSSPPATQPTQGVLPAGGARSTSPAYNAVAANAVATNPATTSPVATNPVTTKPPAPGAKHPAPGAPQVPEESATIRDDPTIAPDPKQSADNSVSFPNDT